MDEKKSFLLYSNNKTFTIPTKFKVLADFPQNIYDTLIFSPQHKYEIKSNVSEEVLRAFINYLKTQHIPEITINNFFEFSELSQEFNQFKEIIQAKQAEFDKNLSYFNGLKSQNQTTRSFYEDQIAQNLDDYLEKYGKDMLKLPIQTLHNIFNHPNIQLTKHDLAYNLINYEFEETKDPNIFVLLLSLDGTKLSRQNFEDSIKSRDLHLGMMPKIETNFLSNSIQRQNSMENEIIKLNKVIESQKITIDNITNEINSLKSIELKQMNEIDDLKNKIQTQSIQIDELRKKHEDDLLQIKKKHSSDIDELKEKINKINELQKIEKDQEKNKIDENSEILSFEFSNNNKLSGIIDYLTKKTGGNIHDNKTIEITSNLTYSSSYTERNLVDFDGSNLYISKNEQNVLIIFNEIFTSIK